MKPVSDRLSSMKLTAAILVLLILWFTWGIFLAGSDTYLSGFKMMNKTLAPAWFKAPEALSPILKIWFSGLCLFMFVLGVNLVFCSWTRMVGILRNRLIRSKIVMLIIHVIFGLVALGHFGSFLLGYRYENVKLNQGQTVSLPDGYALTATNVHFVDDPEVLKKPIRQLGPDQYHPRMNFLEAVLTREGNRVATARIYSLSPLTHKDIQVTLKRFTPPKGAENKKGNIRKPGVVLTISRNPVKVFVFALFPIMIVGIGIYAAMTWKSQNFNESNITKGGKE